MTVSKRHSQRPVASSGYRREEASPERSYTSVFYAEGLKDAPTRLHAQPPPLPICRVKEDPAFTYTGVDFAGPLMIRSSIPKVWMALFTCYITRAIHLEVVPDQSTQAFIRCLKRFVARRGIPRRFISDNGKTFKATAKYLDSVFKDGSVQEHLAGFGSSMWSVLHGGEVHLRGW